MADAQQMEEALQQSVMLSERDAELDDAVADEDVTVGNEPGYASTDQFDVGSTVEAIDQDEEMDDGEERHGESDENEGLAVDDDEEEDRQSEDHSDNSEEEDAFEEDAEGEEDDDMPRRSHIPSRRARTAQNEQHEDDDDDEDEGVGAVKIKPGETDDEDDSDESVASSPGSMSDAESEASGAWDEDAQHQGVEEDDDDVSVANGNNCMFCKQDEDHDPAPDFEMFMTCARCGDNSHQQCAREADALSSNQSPDSWKCPDCIGEGSDAGPGREEEDEEMYEVSIPGDPNRASRRSSAPKLARDLLPPQKGATKPDQHSMFDQLVLGEDPMDGSRVLRKRKTSSAEADEGIMSLRKRRRNTGDESIDGTNDRDESTRPVSSARSLRKTAHAPVTIQKKSQDELLVQMRVNASQLRQIVSEKPKARGERKRSHKAGTGRSSRGRKDRKERKRDDAITAALATVTTPFTTTSYSQPFYSFYDKETDELKGKPYGGILTEAEADTTKTLPTNDDRRRFDEAKQQAEEEWRQRLIKMQAEIDVPAKKSKKAVGPANQIECIEFGGWEIDTWYTAPYPEEYARNRVLYICEFCLKYMNSDYVAWRHKLKCPAKHPPGDEIYRHGSVSVFEVDGRKNPVYCQNLCLLAKLFLGSKTLYYDVEPFLFYVLCEYDDYGYHFVGYFSKEKRASSQNNVSCILTLPIHQRKGYGNLLIDFSYLLTRVEQKTGSPEKPLSDMGLVSYRNYWRLIMCRYLLRFFSDNIGERKGLSIKNISDDTGLTPDDVISALEGLRCLVRDPQTQLYAFRVDLQYCREYVAKWESKNYVQLNPSALTWTPYVMGRSNATNFELGPALNAIAPREDVEEPKTAVSAGESLVNGTASIPQPEAPEVELKVDVDITVLESTEPNETEHISNSNGSVSGAETKPNGILVNGDFADHHSTPHGPEAAEESRDAADDWISQYKDIPPTRFEVVPPITGTRRAERVRVTINRPPAVRTASSIARPRPKRRPSAGGSSRRTSSTSKPKSSSKRKSGGTGRGPGRWPKGTKKSDYGNADSGPGLPPAWVAERNRLAQLGAGKKVDSQDTVQVQTEGVKETKSQRGNESVSTRRNGSVGEGSVVSKGRPSPRSQSSNENSNLGTDVAMGDDDDAAGEEEDAFV
ncbi:hypothetical protein B0H66DRAFT_293673 [Apodospora peruviana]|uniref:Histone acetyltransferase n=1 Tax=Apodospora peruviana TaxID=516989 RepID=A0AAE0I0R7_9PEZI|nr:hypothetical protein B0H66DRAFT_293673 [Apodospora peruviana]